MDGVDHPYLRDWDSPPFMDNFFLQKKSNEDRAVIPLIVSFFINRLNRLHQGEAPSR